MKQEKSSEKLLESLSYWRTLNEKRKILVLGLIIIKMMYAMQILSTSGCSLRLALGQSLLISWGHYENQNVKFSVIT